MLDVDHVSKTYPGGTRAVEDFSLTVEQGSTTVFLGTSGCGKTTLMRLASAEAFPSTGEATLLGVYFSDAGQHVRSAVGVAALPLGAPVEVEVVLAVRD